MHSKYLRAAGACALSVTELRAAYASLALSPLEATRAVLDRADELNAELWALFWIDREQALAAARESERRWRSGAPLSALDGVPVTIKDWIPTAGMPSPCAADLWNGAQDDASAWTVDDPSVRRLREAGAILIGKTTQPEFAAFVSGVNSLYGVARNPWDPSRTPGGSSSGAAIAAATGIGPIAIGSDGGGSIRMPASYCGVLGFKPTGGLVPSASRMAPISVTGPLARTVRDAAIALDVIARPDPVEVHASRFVYANYAQALERPPGRLRVAYCPQIGFGLPLSERLRPIVERAVRTLGDCDMDVELIPPIFDFHVYDDCFPAYSYALFRAMEKMTSGNPDRLARLRPELRAFYNRAARVTLPEYLTAEDCMLRTRQAVSQALHGFDLLVTPTMPIAPFRADACWPEVVTPNDFGYGFDHGAFVAPFNICARPACSVPVGLDAEGLPVGLQIVGELFGDTRVLQAAHALEAALGSTALERNTH